MGNQLSMTDKLFKFSDTELMTKRIVDDFKREDYASNDKAYGYCANTHDKALSHNEAVDFFTERGYTIEVVGQNQIKLKFGKISIMIYPYSKKYKISSEKVRYFKELKNILWNASQYLNNS